MKEDYIPKFVWNYYPTNYQGYLRLNNNPIDRQTVLVKGKVILDLDQEGNVVGIEIIDI